MSCFQTPPALAEEVYLFLFDWVNQLIEISKNLTMCRVCARKNKVQFSEPNQDFKQNVKKIRLF